MTMFIVRVAWHGINCKQSQDAAVMVSDGEAPVDYDEYELPEIPDVYVDDELPVVDDLGEDGNAAPMDDQDDAKGGDGVGRVEEDDIVIGADNAARFVLEDDPADASDVENDNDENPEPEVNDASNLSFFATRTPWFLKNVVASSVFAMFSAFVQGILKLLPTRFRAFLYNLPLMIGTLVVLAFGAKNTSLAQGNRFCSIVSFISSIFGVFFPTSISELIDKTGIKESVTEVGIFAVCPNPKCRKVYDLKLCSTQSGGVSKTMLCTHRRFPDHSQQSRSAMCGTPLLPLKRNSVTGECEELPKYKDRYLYIGTLHFVGAFASRAQQGLFFACAIVLIFYFLCRAFSFGDVD
jgi:hypothetical protein